jgi:hypothetical protein
MGSVVTDVRYIPTTPSSSSMENAGASAGKDESPVQVILEDGSVIDGDAVLMTVPLGVLKKSTQFLSFLFFFFSFLLYFYFFSLFFI